MSVKFITAIYSDLYGSKFGGRIGRGGHYRWSLLSLLKMTNADFLCYTSDREYEDLKRFFYEENSISEEKLKIVIYDLEENYFKNLMSKYKDLEGAKNSDRCIEIQYMKFMWYNNEDKSYDYYFWIDAGLSYCGLIPNKHLEKTGVHNSQYYSSPLFNNKFLSNLIEITENKFLVIAKENERNYWSGTVNPCHFFNYNKSRHIIGGMFGGKKEFWDKIVPEFEKYVYQVAAIDGRLYHEEDIMTLMFRNYPEWFHSFEFDTWWHEDERIAGLNMEDHVKTNKSFFKILEELNGIEEEVEEIILTTSDEYNINKTEKVTFDGLKINFLIEVLVQTSNGDLSKDNAKKIVQLEFPILTENQIENIFNSIVVNSVNPTQVAIESLKFIMIELSNK